MAKPPCPSIYGCFGNALEFAISFRTSSSERIDERILIFSSCTLITCLGTKKVMSGVSMYVGRVVEECSNISLASKLICPIMYRPLFLSKKFLRSV
jgi:hypothetical protein